jgi:hypothetical protein
MKHIHAADTGMLPTSRHNTSLCNAYRSIATVQYTNLHTQYKSAANVQQD